MAEGPPEVNAVAMAALEAEAQARGGPAAAAPGPEERWARTLAALLARVPPGTEPAGPEDWQRYGACAVHGPFPLYRRLEGGRVVGLRPVCPACQRQAELNAVCGAPNLAGCTFDSYELCSQRVPAAQAQVLAACRQYATRFAEMRELGRCVLMLGNSGTGKNHLAAAICREVAGRGATVLHATAAEVIERVRETWSERQRGAQREVIAGYVAADLLVLDEIGRTAGTANEQDILFRVIDGRRRENRPLIAIGNLDEAGMEAYLGAAAFSRLCDNRVVKLRFTWEDYRRRA